ncbi:MAG: PIG-L family deacetylase [Anaerolineae bacterium]|jgi:LmbE family N-acetylglucosaminyl deacetylase|nr:PIG-L family deacetylase [Anaerolineae bacterium]
MDKKRLLIAFAHPDDESFGLGGLISKYVADGVEVYYVCSTNGDVGTIPESMQGKYGSIAELRLSELDCASAKLGFTEVVKVGYKDSGMMGSDTSKDPACSWYIWEHTPKVMIDRMVHEIRRIQPQVVITFNKYGAYGHPDHIAIQRATTEAFHLASDPAYMPDDLPAYKPQKLYYTNIPKRTLQLGIFLMRLRRQNPRALGVNKDIDVLAILENCEPAHVSVNIANYLKAWEDANSCHASQGGGRRGILPFWLRKVFGGKQSLTRVYPVPNRDKIDEHDIFQNVSV